MSSQPIDEEDVLSGAAAERTFLAWTRTSIALAAGGTAVGHAESLPMHAPVGVGLVLMGLAFWALAGAHYRRARRHVQAGTFAVNLTGIRLMALITFFGAVAAFVVALRAP